MPPMGDKVNKPSATPVNTTNAATQAQGPEPKLEPEVASQKPIESFFRKSVAPTPELQALYVNDTITDGSKMVVDNIFEQTWTLYNPGPRTWPVGCSLRYVGGDNMLNVSLEHPSSVDVLTAAMESNVLGQAVEPGDSADFTVTLRAPQRTGKAISYWRLKTAEGIPFGHKLWCDIDVSAEHNPSVKIENEDEEQPTEELATERSSMIFPTLEKESPASSVHEVSADLKEAISNPAEVLTSKDEEEELAEEIESLELEEDDETDDAFLTDEEYDILDASDEDLLEEAQKAVKKA